MRLPGTRSPGCDEPVFADGAHFVNGRSLTPAQPAGLEIADVGMGCIWGADACLIGLGISSESKHATSCAVARLIPD